ncbi:hypothetical protein BDQ17DRAFT_1536663 [Cyathus striatus]|nr:hypothetical protein BDQ17DRAFT_1536663 [Cyathus striatus]
MAEEFLATLVPSSESLPADIPSINFSADSILEQGDDVDVNNSMLALMNESDLDINMERNITGATYPGIAPVRLNCGWDLCSLTLECTECRDPVDTKELIIHSTTEDMNIITHLVDDAMTLLCTSARCYVFVIGVYYKEQKMRIYRFDHAGFRFLWKLSTPYHNTKHTVVGWDETIRIPTDDEYKNMVPRIQQLTPEVQLNKRTSLWVKVRLNASFKSQSACKNISKQPQADHQVTGSWSINVHR